MADTTRLELIENMSLIQEKDLNKELDKKLLLTERKLEDVLKKYSDLTEKLDAFKEKNKEQDVSIAEMKLTIEQKDKAIGTFEKKVAELESENQSLEGLMEAKTEIIVTMKEGLDNKEKTISDLESIISELRQSYKNSAETIHKYEKDIKRLHGLLDDANEKLIQKDTEKEVLIKENEKLQQQFCDFTQENQILLQKFNKGLNELDNIKLKTKDLYADIARLKSTLNSKDKENQELLRICHRANEQAKRWETKFYRVEADYNSIRLEFLHIKSKSHRQKEKAEIKQEESKNSGEQAETVNKEEKEVAVINNNISNEPDRKLAVIIGAEKRKEFSQKKKCPKRLKPWFKLAEEKASGLKKKPLHKVKKTQKEVEQQLSPEEAYESQNCTLSKSLVKIEKKELDRVVMYIEDMLASMNFAVKHTNDDKKTGNHWLDNKRHQPTEKGDLAEKTKLEIMMTYMENLMSSVRDALQCAGEDLKAAQHAQRIWSGETRRNRDFLQDEVLSLQPVKRNALEFRRTDPVKIHEKDNGVNEIIDWKTSILLYAISVMGEEKLSDPYWERGKVFKDKAPSIFNPVDAIVSLEMLKTHITQGYTSLMDQRFHSAEKSFAFLLNNLDSSQLQQLNLAVVDYVVIIYGYATALIGIGQPEELTKAKGHFNNIIEQYQKLRFDCLAHYGIGKVYLRQNRFSDALEQFMKSKTMVHHKMVPGVLTWPTTSIVIEETRTEKLQVILQDCIEECKFPPNADAVCRYQNCQAHKIKIYFSDPDFKGFIRVACCEQCIVEFHVSCWKKQKATRYSDKNDKDILRELCFTPDCEGLISKIVIVGASGFVKCEFEQKIKKKTPPRPVIKQKCSSSRNIERKQQRKLKRKFMKEEVSVQLRELAEAFHKEDCPARDASKKGNHEDFFPKDPVLQLIIRHSVNIRAGVRDAFKLLNELLSWSVLSEEDCVEFSTGCGSSAEIMDQLINFLVAKNERVKTRIFVHVLSEFEEVEPKLHDWMKHLDNKGLKATDSFFAQYIVYTVEADFKLVAVLWNEKYGIKLGKKFTCTSEDKIEWLDYLCNLSTIDLRYFLWLLEENREKFPFFHQYLDDYFDSWDNPFTVIRKEETETTSNNAIKVKNRNRKKAKESKAILVVPGGVSTIAREEDNIFSEESTLSFMNSHEPFRIPDSLHEQVEIFEALNNNVSSSSSYQRILDNYPNPTCESLYDYFSQILEEHGPMEIDHQLLVGEYKHFPAETRKIVEDAGGLKSFLLESLRFVMMGDLIGLMKHAVMLTENADVSGVDEITRKKENNSACLHSEENSSQSKVRLNPAAKEFKPTSYINKPFVTISSNTVTSNTLEYMTVNSSSFTSFVSEYSSSRAVDTIATSLPFSKVSLSSAISENPPVFLNADPLQCQDERIVPVLSETPLVPDILEQPKYICTDNDAYLDTDSKAILGSNYSAGNLVASDEVQKFQNPQCMPVESDSHISENHPYQSENCSNEGAKMETEIKTIARNNPRSRMIAVQVDQERTDKGVNTLPLHPYETQQGDMLRTEKEHQVLQEQLKDASEKYEQLKCRSSTETSGLEDELSLLIEGNKLTKRELDWFHQDVEMEMKRWQQEKKENQEGLKTGKSKVKKLTEINETYMKNTEEKDKQYKQYLEEFLAISNKFENEKVKMEELIKKSCGDHQECVKRAVAAEVSVLENWKETELYKLQRRATHAEANLKYLKFMTSHSTVPQSKLQIDSWETFISNIKEEIRNTENEFEERIHKVKNGAFLNDIPMVEIAELQSPSGLSLATCEWPLINDPAIVMYSATATYLSSAFSNTDDNDPVHSAITVQPGIKTSSKGARLPLAKKDIGETSLESKAQSLSDHVCLPDSPENSRKSVQAIHLQYRTPEESPPTAGGLDHVKTISKPLPKASTNIIAQLRTIFPHHSSSDLENFIKEVKVKSKNKLSTDELLSRVTEFILDHPNKKKVLCSSGKIEKPSSSASGQNGNQIQKVLKMSGRNVPNLAKSRVTNENIKKTTLPPQSVQMPWKTVGGTSKSKWKKPSDMDNDPCVICHEELSSEMLHVLDCGHRFHKLCIGPWIKEHSTCPTCRQHVLLPEDYPELPGRNRTP